MYSFFDPDLFKERLSETIFWCNNQMEISTEASTLRSLVSEPSDIDDLHQNDTLAEEFARNIFYERKQQIAHAIYKPNSDKINLQGGILVIFLASLAAALDGGSQIFSKDFFDYNGFPAWDTWVYHVSQREMKKAGVSFGVNHVICWAPPPFVEGIREAIFNSWDQATLELNIKNKNEFDYLKNIDDLIEY